ncbi:GH3 auxin-responsive promoter family protein [Odoribacter sp. OttesenSCG-928-A06]|nr:GH3 auxin-responsive promoter family protein [Odoribacter sp. OttesenSCG-928-A06]
MALLNSLITLFTSKRITQIDAFKENPGKVQRQVLEELLSKASKTEYGQKYHFDTILTPEQYRERLPIIQYEDVREDIKQMMAGKQNILWAENIEWFAKSSGTTGDRSKYIPVSPAILEEGQFRGGKDAIAIFNKLYPESQAFAGKTLALGGSSEISETNANCRYGDLSAIMISNTPFWANLKKTPNSSVMLMSKWEEKIEKIIETTLHEDVRCLMGVPSWFLSLSNQILEKTGKKNLHEIWPNLELFIHGGISFTPYREQYKRLLPDPKMKYMETYNASEGFFGIQDDPNDSSLLLMLDYGVYYEFMPTSEWGKSNPKTLLLEETKTGVTYALVISTSGGLWRYMIGDTIMFTSTTPYKFKITGRTKLFINAFGEELIIDNATEAINYACQQTGSAMFEFTAAPIFMDEGKRGAHEWIIEFTTPPQNMDEFAEILDTRLQELNSDYEAKRMLSLERLKVHTARPELFNDWLKDKGKLGGQNKVPRLWNDRTHIEQLLLLNKESGEL